ncbi:hypothetical protein [Kitasatospora azatica]|uniref:hypothetical protein n=1 Tax=Kitasatospora azatica TaxID=58347 RepID=UPI0018DDC7FA|nr:hypothetical protein [Kitasatospora azatica]
MALSPSLASRSTAEPADGGAQQPDAPSADAPSGANGAPGTAAAAGAPGQRAPRVPGGRPADGGATAPRPAVPAPGGPEDQQPGADGTVRRRPRGRAPRRPSGRERHDEKITVYVSAEELMDLEHARLVLRGEHGLAVDRGRVVREAIAVVLADLEQRGEASILVRRLRNR